MKKRMMALILCVVLTVTAFCFTSCADKKLDDYNGRVPEEVLKEALVALDECNSYQLTSGVDCKIKIGFVPIMGIKESSLFHSVRNNGNVAFYVDTDAAEKLKDTPWKDLTEKADNMVYVDGIAYVDNGTDKAKEEYPYNPIQELQMVEDLVRSVSNGTCRIECRKGRDGCYFYIEMDKSIHDDIYDEVENQAGDFGVSIQTESVTYKVYLDDEGRIEKILCSDVVSVFIVKVDATTSAIYEYDDVPAVTAPADADSYTWGRIIFK